MRLSSQDGVTCPSQKWADFYARKRHGEAAPDVGDAWPQRGRNIIASQAFASMQPRRVNARGHVQDAIPWSRTAHTHHITGTKASVDGRLWCESEFEEPLMLGQAMYIHEKHECLPIDIH